ncbi:MAG: hypothetical protein AB1749_17105 [Pseudomonadota bacterium]
MPKLALAITELVDRRRRELGLTPADLIRNCGYRNVAKGLRRLAQLRSGDLAAAAGLIERLPAALDLALQDLDDAVARTRRQQSEAADAAWRATFAPHAIILTERSVPQPIFVAALIGVDRLLRIDFDRGLRPVGYVRAAVEGVRRRLQRFGSDRLPAFGRPVGIVVSYTPDYAVRCDLDGRVVETMTSAPRICLIQHSFQGSGAILPLTGDAIDDVDLAN